MCNTTTVYIGSYVKIQNKAIRVQMTKCRCPTCMQETAQEFCFECNSKTVKSQESSMVNIVHLIRNLDIGYLSIVDDADTKAKTLNVIFDTNYKFSCVFDGPHQALEEKDFPKKATEEDFKDLIELLKKHNLEYKLCYGVIVYE